MAAANEFLLRLYDSPYAYSVKATYREIASRELLKEKRVFLVGRWTQLKADLLHELYESVNKQNKNSFLYEHLDYLSLIKDIRVRADKKAEGYVFIIESMRSLFGSLKEETAELYAVLKDYPNLSFCIATEYGGFETENQSESMFHMLKVAELVSVDEIKQQNQNAPPVEEEIVQQKVDEVQQQKSGPEEKIKQQKSEPGIKRSARRASRQKRFEPTSTKYDDVFREVINDSAFLNLKTYEGFILENERRHFKSLIAILDFEERSESASIAMSIEAELKKSSLSLEEFSPTFSSYAFWNAIVLVVNDLSKAHEFSRPKKDYEKNVSKSYPELERKWASELLKMFISPGPLIVPDLFIRNSFAYYESPQAQPYIFDESIKKQVVEKIFEREYTSENFSNFVWGYFESLSQDNPKDAENLGFFVASVLLHPKIRSIWDDAKSIEDTPPSPFNDGRVIGQYSPDEASVEDHLGFKHDVHALAALIAYEKTPLPLAIGLFGNWGSGKSSFMKQLQKRVNTLSTEQYENKEVVAAAGDEMPYCSKIAHITFNAWHYSDANLWASMMVHIFDELLKNIVAPVHRDKLRADLINKLSTAREALKEAEKQLQESQSQRSEAELALAKVQSAKHDLDAQLVNVKLSLSDLATALMSQDQFKSDVKFIAKEIGYDKLVQTKEELETLKTEMSSRAERWKRALGNLFRGNVQYSLLCLMVIVLPVVAGAIVLQKWEFASFKMEVIASFTAPVLAFGTWIRTQFGKFDKALEKIEAMQSVATNKIKADLEAREKTLEDKLAAYEAAVKEKVKQVEIAKQNEKDAKEALDSIDVNKQLTSFIQQRQSGNNYQQHLGIISMIRKDFEMLSDYLRTSRKEKKRDDRIIDRIVLYIDDLDRCKTDRVVAVLEAVHLLLAIDLFVVVVGVDPRWVSKALKEQYKEQLHLDAAEDSDTSRLPGQRATPFDYLEKIFQVPFVLRSMDNSGAKKLLDNLFKGQVKAKEAEKVPAAVPFSGPLNDPFNTGNSVMKDPFDEKNLTEAQKEAMKKKAAEMEAESKKQEAEKEKKEKEEAAQKEFIEQVENLTISEEELEFMKNIAPIIGATPRTVKRYGNLYRLLRVHSDLPNYSIEKLDVYQSVMLLLSISVSNGSIARPFFAALRESKKAGFNDLNAELIEALRKEIIDSASKKEEKDEEEKEKEDVLHEQLQALNQLHAELGKLPAEIKNFSVATLKKYSPVVSRFSFRTLNCFEEEMQSVTNKK